MLSNYQKSIIDKCKKSGGIIQTSEGYSFRAWILCPNNSIEYIRTDTVEILFKKGYLIFREDDTDYAYNIYTYDIK